jgi:hypothetical protein
MRITGLTQKDQAASLDLELAGPLGDAWTLLRQPRLQLLSRHPVELGDPTGQIATRLHLELPLDNNVTADQIVFHTQGQLSNVHLTLAGRSVDQGTLDFDASGDGLKLSGPLQIATIPAQLAVQMDFRPGPPNQVQTRVNLSGDANISQLAAAGIDSYGLLSGRATISATLEERRNGSGQASIHVDLQNTKMQLDPVGWRREAGGSAQGDVHIVLDHDHFVAIDRLNIDGDGISVVGGATVADGQPVILRLERVALGETRASGTISFNRPPSRVINVVLAGPTLDFSGRFDEPSPAKPNAATTPAAKAPSDQGTSGPPWSVDLQFDQVLLARRQRLSGVRVQADDDGQILRRVRLSGQTGIDEPVTLSIERETDGRRLTAEAANAGAVLSAADIARTVVGGKLTVSGRFDDRTSEHRLNGTIGITNFRVRRAPAAAKLLQAMTLYGLVDALQEPGLGVSQMILPFQKTGEKVELSDARAFSPSLGVTAKGRVDLGNNTADLTGTIVPAYFFNTLLGGLPLVGQLFSPEKGGGVFAATYYIKGPLDDPSVGVNPLAVLTPGFLRGLFGIFDGVK